MKKGNEKEVFDYGSSNVLASTKSQLAGCFFNSLTNQLLTVDEDCLVRLWDLKQGICIKSYPLESPKAKGQIANEDNMANFSSKHPISCIRLSQDNKHFVVAFEGGTMQINNAYSGTLLFNKTEESKIDLEHEVANLGFFCK